MPKWAFEMAAIHQGLPPRSRVMLTPLVAATRNRAALYQWRTNMTSPPDAPSPHQRIDR